MSRFIPFNPHNEEERKKVRQIVDEWTLENYPLLSTDLNPDGDKALQDLMQKADDLLKEGKKPVEMIKTIYEYQNGCLAGYLWQDYSMYPYLNAYMIKICQGIYFNYRKPSPNYEGNQDLLDFALRVFGFPLSYGLELHVDERLSLEMLRMAQANVDLDFSKYVQYSQKIWDLYDKMKKELPECYKKTTADRNIYDNCCQLMKITGPAKLNEKVERRLITKMFEFRDYHKVKSDYENCINNLAYFVSYQVRNEKYPDLYKQIADYVYENQLQHGDFSLVQHILRLKFENKQEYAHNVVDIAKQQALKGNLEPCKKLKDAYAMIVDADKQCLAESTINLNQ